MKQTLALLTTLLLAPLAALNAADPGGRPSGTPTFSGPTPGTLRTITIPSVEISGSLLPAGWDPALAGDAVLKRLVKVTAPQVKGAHDAEFVCVGERACIVEHDNDVAPGHGAGAAMYCVLTVVNLKTLCVEKTHLLAKAGQAFANVTLPDAQVFVPRIIPVANDGPLPRPSRYGQTPRRAHRGTAAETQTSGKAMSDEHTHPIALSIAATGASKP